MITTTVLPNGVRLVLEHIPSVRSVAMGIWIGTGSRYETKENNGISHFLEHMLFKGTEKRTAREIAEEFDSIGGHVNAFTSKEYTCYYAKVLDQHLPLAIDVLADMFFNSKLDPQELEKEKNVVLEEFKMYEDTPDDVIHDLIAQATFPKHALGYTILGEEEVITKLTSEDLAQYMETHYTPENIVIAIAGNVQGFDIVRLVESYFGHFKRSGQQSLIQAERANTTLQRKKDTEQAHVCLSYPGVPLGHKDIYNLILLNNIFGGSMSSRLFQEIREQHGLAYSVFSYHTSFRDIGALNIYAGTAPHQLEQVYELVHKEIKQLLAHGISEKELRNGKEQLKGNLMLSLESTNARMSRIGKNELLLGRHLTLDEIIERIDALTIEGINHFAEGIFTESPALALISPLEELPQAIQEQHYNQ